MRLRVLLPTKVLVDKEVSKVVAEAENGAFCLLPQHINFVSALAPGLLAFVPSDPQAGESTGETVVGKEEYVAVDEGILVKSGSEVLVSTRKAVLGPELGKLRQMVEESFRALDEREEMTRSAISKLEADFVRRFIELGE